MVGCRMAVASSARSSAVSRSSHLLASVASHTWAARMGAGSEPVGVAAADRLTGADQARFSELIEVLGHCLSADRQAPRQISDCCGSGAGELVQQRTPGRIGERREHRDGLLL